MEPAAHFGDLRIRLSVTLGANVRTQCAMARRSSQLPRNAAPSEDSSTLRVNVLRARDSEGSALRALVHALAGNAAAALWREGQALPMPIPVTTPLKAVSSTIATAVHEETPAND